MKTIIPVTEEIENDLKLLDEIELAELVKEARKSITDGDFRSHLEVKRRLSFPAEQG